MKQAILMDSQILNDLESCPTKLELHHNQKLVPIIKATALEKGDLFHRALSLWRRLSVHRTKWEFEKRENLCIKLMQKLIVKMNASLDELEPEIEYFKFYVEIKYRSDDQFLTISVEKPFIKQIYECDDFVLFWTGQPDWIFIDVNGLFHPSRKGQIYVLDTKTGSRDIQPHKLSNQFIGYCYGLEGEELIVDKVNFYVKLDPEKSFKRRIITIDHWLKERWYGKVIKRAHEYFRYIQSGIDELTDTNYTSCDKYSGCIFREICETVPGENETVLEARQFIKDRDFKKETWDVSKILGR